MASTVRDILLVAGPLAAIWLSNWLIRAREVRQWRRDRCLEAYADVLRTNEAVVNKATALFLEDNLMLLQNGKTSLNRSQNFIVPHKELCYLLQSQWRKHFVL